MHAGPGGKSKRTQFSVRVGCSLPCSVVVYVDICMIVGCMTACTLAVHTQWGTQESYEPQGGRTPRGTRGHLGFPGL